MSKVVLIILGIIILVVGGFFFFKSDKEEALPIDDVGSETIQENIQNLEEGYSFEEIALHNSKDDCWFAIDNKVYDVTDFISSHPGGKSILEGCGKDATQLFETRPMGSGAPHSSNARQLLNDYYIGDLNVD